MMGSAMGLVENILFRLSRRGLRAKAAGRDADVAHTRDDAAYRQWRDAELRGQLEDHFPVKTVRGKEVLDFGCGEGMLAARLSRLRAARVLGTDLADELIAKARRMADEERLANVEFAVAGDPRTVAAADASFDLLCAFDVVEHIMHPEDILREWRRVLRPGGEAWLWWLPWRSPYGHHMTSLIPLPWVHVLCRERTLIEVAARIYDDPCFIPRTWNLDPETGEKLPNKWRAGADLSSWLNKMTLRRFKRLARAAGFETRVSVHGFGSSGVKRLVGSLAHVPLVGEFFTSCNTAVLRKPAGPENLQGQA